MHGQPPQEDPLVKNFDGRSGFGKKGHRVEKILIRMFKTNGSLGMLKKIKLITVLVVVFFSFSIGIPFSALADDQVVQSCSTKTGCSVYKTQKTCNDCGICTWSKLSRKCNSKQPVLEEKDGEPAAN